ncbi:MAG: PHP domain-containing protein [Candidatus Aureabacteria bacterium]|nr:PHP domain-containing protein [Candidatus Auribacterota bacterium]NLW93831.1 PHP domain-containing protein [Chlamydiota bacterium]HOE26506.1 PHP domain-containing protein [bacterium]HQM53325.1 PHP domain-containing protein [bacterium]
MLLKADFHVHTSEDPEDPVEHSALELIDTASRLGYGVLSITNHNTVTWDEQLAAYAERKGILLLPGVELSVAGKKHVLVVNSPLRGANLARSFPRFEDLAAVRGESSLVIAPHPFHRAPVCLGSDLETHRHLFDAVESSHFHSRLFALNRRSESFSRRYGIPMVGTSDAHFRSQFGRAYSLVEAERNPKSVVEAVRKGRVQVVCPPLTVAGMAGTLARMLVARVRSAPARER